MSKQEPVAWTTQANFDAFVCGENEILIVWRSNEELGDVSLYTADYAESLRQQRDDLLAALEMAREITREGRALRKMCDAAIAKAKEQA